VVAATSEPNRVVTNGMSQYSRNERNANSGFVVGIDPERDYPDHPLAGIEFQRKWESLAFTAGGGDYKAPAQKVGDFLARKPSEELGVVEPSYKPGIKMTDLAECLPAFVLEAMREALPVFGRQIAGYDHPDVLMTGVETRTSSPIRITRGKDFQSLNVAGLFPAGEGAGLCRRHPLGGGRRHQGGRGGGGGLCGGSWLGVTFTFPLFLRLPGEGRGPGETQAPLRMNLGPGRSLS
jgi:uncharacterized FAD-dependent dehydrogenase